VRTVYLGSSAFAAAVLGQLARSPHRPCLVITRPERPKGRGRKLQPPPVAIAADELQAPLYQPESVNSEEARARIHAAEPEAVIVCAFGALITEPLLSDHLMLNVHPSLLPRWRGAAPIERAIMAGDERTGVSIMVLTAGLDSGPVCRQAEEPIRPGDDYGSLSTRLQTLGGQLLVQELDERSSCREQDERSSCREQDEAQASYAEKIAASDRRLDPGQPAAVLARQVRALTPHIGAYIELSPTDRLGVTQAQVTETRVPAGQLDLDGPRPVLGCADGGLELIAVQPPGKRPMGAEDYLRGRRR
jgi:methionyl-tRNA formyltransferase